MEPFLSLIHSQLCATLTVTSLSRHNILKSVIIVHKVYNAFTCAYLKGLLGNFTKFGDKLMGILKESEFIHSDSKMVKNIEHI